MKAGEVWKVLIVDDEPLIRKGIVHYIDWEKEGFFIAGEASNGREALELAESVHPDIIITDIVMPIMDGEELTRVVKERYPNIEIIILSSYGEFDYVRSTFQHGAVDYILKPKLDAESLLKGLKAAAGRLPSDKKIETGVKTDLSVDQIIDKLISGYGVKVNEESVSKVFPFPFFYLLGADARTRTAQGKADLQTIVKEKVVEGLRSNIRDGVYYSFRLNKNQAAILINTGNDIKKDLERFIHHFSENVPGVGFALTETFQDFFQLGKVSQDHLMKLLNYRFYLSEWPLLMEGNLPERGALVERFNLDQFTEDFKRKDFDAAFSYLKDHAATLSRCYTADIFEFKAFFSNVIFNTAILLSNMEYDTKELDSAKYMYLRSFDEVSTAREAVGLLGSFIEEAKKCLAGPQTSKDNLNLKKVVEYMNKHYAEPLTLTEMAKHFHFNPSYFSNYFSTHMNEGFVEYLNKIRIEEAIRLLKDGTASISEISGMVGYSDHSYFCRVFKKIKGLSPSQYKRKTLVK